jgi:hypothetical protein
LHAETQVKRLLIVLLVLSACRPIPSTVVTGASSPEGAVDAFIKAAAAQDLQAMGAVWGTARGAARETIERSELERRELIMIRLLCQEEFRVVSAAPGVDGRRALRLDMTRAGRTVPVTFTTIQGPGARWYVEDVEVAKLQELCTSR